MPQPLRIPRFAGMTNRLPEFMHLARDNQKHYLHNAVNVDLTQVGTLKRRKGTTLLISGDDVHSLWANENADQAWFVNYDTLYELKTDFTTSTARTTTPARRVSYVETPDGVIASNGIWLDRLISGSTAVPFTVPIPSSQPIVTVSTGGSLPAGRYMVCYTLVDAYGREGGTTTPVVATLSAPGIISVSGISPPTGYTSRVYMTPTNGDVFYEVAHSTSVPVAPAFTRRCPTFMMQPMPPGNIVRYYNGRLLTVEGNFLFYSEPYNLALYNAMRNFVVFQEPISIVEPVNDGVFVAAEETYFLKGEITQAELVTVAPYGAVPFCSGKNPIRNEVFWMSEKGIVRAGDGGVIKNVQESTVEVEHATSGAALFRNQDGMRQMIATLFGTRENIAVAGTWMEAEVVRRGEIL